MKMCLAAIVASLSTYATADAAPAASPLMAPVHQFIDSFNKGDQKTAAAAFAPGGLAIIDEVAPHVWTGPTALTDWANDLAAHDRQNGDTDGSVVLGPATREVVSGDRGYLVVSVTYLYKEHGAAMREPAQMTYAFSKGPGGWLITGWTWVGTKPVARHK
ncbi:MAG TPA: hypothetical protein VF459_03170 [Caulobacteraceae bacterium]